ncbi:hypothetical protein J6590_101069, partial [Homalodisca vitripennis]
LRWSSQPGTDSHIGVTHSKNLSKAVSTANAANRTMISIPHHSNDLTDQLDCLGSSSITSRHQLRGFQH